jgi:hypothetical protein
VTTIFANPSFHAMPWPIPDDADESFLNDWLLGIRGVDGDHESDKR